MNLLVAIGLLALGVIMIVALVFVLRSEPTTEESVSVPPPVPTVTETAEKRTALNQSPSTAQVPPTPDLSAVDFSDTQLVPTWHPLANGQFYELKNELHNLHGQAQDLEHRIRTLVDMVERIEQTPDGRFPGEEQPADSAGTQATQ